MSERNKQTIQKGSFSSGFARVNGSHHVTWAQHPSLKIVNVTRAVKMPSDLHENSFQKTSITANSEQALRNRCCLVDFDTNSNKWSLGRSSHRVSKDAESQQGKPLNVKTPRRETPCTFTQTITHTITSKSDTAWAEIALFPFLITKLLSAPRRPDAD